MLTGGHRCHEDLDTSIDAADADELRLFLTHRGWTTWNVDSGWLRPFDHRFREIRPDSNIWVRADAQSPWILDIPLTPFRDGLRTTRKDRSQAMSLQAATWTGEDGLRYLNPEIVLYLKARQARQKDIQDAAGALPMLDAQRRTWLREAIARVDATHPWARLS